MTRVLWFSVALALLAAGRALASSDEVVISTGRDRGSYYYIGQRFKTELLLENYPGSTYGRARARSTTCDCWTTPGAR